MAFKKKFKNKSEALIEADKILRLIHHYNGKYKYLIESSYLDRLEEETKLARGERRLKKYVKEKNGSR